jgi:hypothetical protein
MPHAYPYFINFLMDCPFNVIVKKIKQKLAWVGITEEHDMIPVVLVQQVAKKYGKL